MTIYQNWFQNRRAREKKEKNIREYEAKQKLEKDQEDTDRHEVLDERKRELVASSAPFPEPKTAPNMQESVDSSDAEDDTLVVPSKAESVHSEDVAISIETTPDLICESSTFGKSGSRQPSHGADASDLSPEDLPDYLSISDTSCDNVALSDSELYMPLANKSPSQFLAAEYPGMMMHPGVSKANQFFSSSMFLGGLQTDQASFQGINLAERDVSISPTSQQPAGFHLKSPPAIDIASRRNRRPTPLSISPSRSCGSGVPKTAVDLSKMTGTAHFMRRTSSNSSSGRVTKALATPRNMFSMNRSPSSTGPASSLAPPTPDTPIVAHQNGMGDMSITSAYGVDGKMAALANHDPTLTTPPSTPGLMDGLFNMNSAYGMNMSDDGIVNTGLSGLPSGFEMSHVPGYVNSSSAGQTRQAMYNPQARQAYMAFYGNGNEWPSSDSLRG